jgi:hypothetical protein
MSDSIDSAVNRSANRAVFVGAAVKHLGTARQRDAEILADLMMAAIDQIVASAAIAIAPSSTGVSDEVLRDLGTQMQRHAEQIAHVAVVAMTDVFLKTLIMAARARSETPVT